MNESNMAENITLLIYGAFNGYLFSHALIRIYHGDIRWTNFSALFFSVLSMLFAAGKVAEGVGGSGGSGDSGGSRGGSHGGGISGHG